MTAGSNTWAKDVQRLHNEAGGALAVQVVQLTDLPGMLGYALAGDPEAARVCTLVSGTLRRIRDAPRKRPMLCASCPAPLRNESYAVVAAFPARSDASQGLGLAICQRCGTTPKAIRDKAVVALRRIWPDVRAVEVTHPDGGRA